MGTPGEVKERGKRRTPFLKRRSKRLLLRGVCGARLHRTPHQTYKSLLLLFFRKEDSSLSWHLWDATLRESFAPNAINCYGAAVDQHPPIAPIADLLLDRIELIPGGTVRLCNPLVYINAGKFSTDFRRRQFWRDTALHEPQAAISFGRYAQAEVTGMGPHILMSQGCIAAEYIPTPKNALVAGLCDALGFRLIAQDAGGRKYYEKELA